MHGKPRIGMRFFRSILRAGILLIPLAACAGDSRRVDDATVARARDALAPFKRELQAALRSGLEQGPAGAIRVCRDLAPQIADSMSVTGVRLGRTSDRVRNPANAPESWMEPFLVEYARNPADREPKAARLDRRTVVYVEPIVVQPVCLNCHGESLAADVEQRLRELYPEDHARGYRQGDFRGIFWVKLTDDAS